MVADRTISWTSHIRRVHVYGIMYGDSDRHLEIVESSKGRRYTSLVLPWLASYLFRSKFELGKLTWQWQCFAHRDVNILLSVFNSFNFAIIVSMYNDIWQPNEAIFPEDLVSSSVLLDPRIAKAESRAQYWYKYRSSGIVSNLVAPRTGNSLEYSSLYSEKYTTAQCLTNVCR